jgi:hypothetical protein
MKGVTEDNFNHRLMRYILGIRYYGYDTQGNLVTSKSGFVKNYSNGFSDDNSVIERYVVVAINDFKFKVNGNSTTYNIELQEAAPQASLGTIIGVIQNSLNINGSTVGEVLMGSRGTNSKSLVSELNSQTKKLTDSSNTTEQSCFVQEHSMCLLNDHPLRKQKQQQSHQEKELRWCILQNLG